MCCNLNAAARTTPTHTHQKGEALTCTAAMSFTSQDDPSANHLTIVSYNYLGRLFLWVWCVL